MNIFTIRLSRDKAKPLYEQLYGFVADEIKCGRLTSGERLPSKKALAAHLQISQNTVETAYAMLAQEGYVYSKPRSGYYVSEIDELIFTPQTTAAEVKETFPEYKYNFTTNLVSSFPYKTWAKLNRQVLLDSPDLLAAGEPQGDFALREALAKYLHEFRGVQCTSRQIFIGAGIEYLLTLISEFIGPGVGFAMENPGYAKAAAVLKNSGRDLKFIPLDNSGMILDRLARSGAGVAYLTPSHQFPTGIIMPIARRAQLLNWAAEAPGRYLIEDDYNSEFNFAGRPIPSIQSIDNYGRVIYMSTFSRILAPSIRIAYMVLPQGLMDEFMIKFRNYSSTVSRFEQHTLCRLITGGYLGRHLNRVKNIYRKRRDLFLEELAPYIESGKMTVSGGGSGLHLLVTMEKSGADKAVENARRESVRVNRLSDYCFEENKELQNTLILGYSGMSGDGLKAAVRAVFSNLTL